MAHAFLEAPRIFIINVPENVDDDSDDVIVIEDDDEGEEGEGGVEFFHSPAEQSMDEADEGVGRVIRLLDVDTSLDEPHRAERENDDLNIESDSRGASSTVAAMAGGGEGLGGRSEMAVEGLLMRGGDQEEDLETGNEVADEEHAATRGAQQTDDEGTTEPSSSDSSMPHRRIRIRFPDIEEPSSNYTG